MKHPMTGLGECLDMLSDARQLIELVRMACLAHRTDEAAFMEAGLTAAMDRFEAAEAGLEDLWRAPGSPGAEGKAFYDAAMARKAAL